MMKLLVFLAIVVIKMADAGLKIMPPQEPPADVPYQLGCWNPELNQYMQIGETVFPEGKCAEHVCGVDEYTRIFTCPSLSPGTCKVIPGDPSATYPDCCSDIKCEPGQVGSGSA